MGEGAARTGRALLAVLALLAADAAAARLHAQACGNRRWAVKTLTDGDAAQVAGTAEITTVAALVGLPPPEGPAPDLARLPLERRRFRVRAVLVERRTQADGDLHLLLADPAHPAARLVAELPDSACAVRSRHASDFAEAARIVSRLPDGLELEVEGIAFWDEEHGVVGAAPNGLELHPVLRLVPVLTRSDLLRAEIGADPPDTTAVRVWVNPASKVYHCPGSSFYGNTARGQYLPEPDAQRAGARPAGGRPCGRVPPAPP